MDVYGSRGVVESLDGSERRGKRPPGGGGGGNSRRCPSSVYNTQYTILACQNAVKALTGICRTHFEYSILPASSAGA